MDGQIRAKGREEMVQGSMQKVQKAISDLENKPLMAEARVGLNPHFKIGLKAFCILITGIILSLVLNAISEPVWAMEGQDLPTDSNPEEELMVTLDIRENNGATPIQEALLLDDEMRVTLQGRIIERLAKDRYLFRDHTGEMVIEIEGDEWYGIEVSPDNMILLQGEIERSRFGTTIVDVDFLLKLE